MMKTYVSKGQRLNAAGTSVLKGLLLALVLQSFHGGANRLLMAANVTASITRQGDLEIRGDHEGNHFEMTHVFVGEGWSLYFLRGKNGTTINGLAEDAFRCEDVTGDIDIRMGYRDDTVDLYGVSVLNDLRIDMGRGDDDVLLSVVVGGQVRVLTREGDDYVWMRSCNCNYMCPPSGSLDHRACDSLIVDTGNGSNDTVWALGVHVSGNAIFSSRTGTNVFFLDRVVVMGSLEILGRAGEELVCMFDVQVLNRIDITLRTHSDLVFMSGVQVASDLNVSTGLANDFVHGWGLQVVGHARFDGGHGQDDWLQLIGGNFFGGVAPVGFEHQRRLR